MADISVIIEVLGNQEIEKATKSMSSLEGRVGTLRKALRQGRISEDQFNQGLKEIRRSIDSQFPSWQKAKAAIDGHVKALDQLEKSQAIERHNKETERLRLQYNATYRAAQSFKTQLRELNEAHSRGAISADRHEQQVRELKNEYRAFLKNGGGPMNQFGQIASKNTRIMKRFGAVGVQQLGYQIQDFAVQVQSGTSVLVALGQQGSQLLGIFGPSGAIAGMILAIGTGLAGAFLAARDAASEMGKSVKELTEDIKNLTAAQNESIRALQLGVTKEELSFIDRIALAKQEQAEAEEQLRIRKRDLQRQNENSAKFYEREAQAVEEAKQAVSDYKQEYEDFLSARELERGLQKLKEVPEQAASFWERLKARVEENVQALKDQTAEVSRLAINYKPLSASARVFKEETEANISKMADVFKNAKDLREELGDAAYEALRLAGVDMTSGVDAAAKAAARLAADLNISLAAALAMQSMASKEEQVMSQPVVSGPATDRFGVEDLLRMGYTEEYLKAVGKIRDSVGGGGGGAGADPMEEYNRARDALAGLVSQYDEGVAVAEKLRSAQITVNDAVKAGVITSEQGQTAMQGYIQSLEQADNPLKKIGETLKSSLGDAFMSIVDGSKSAADAFKDMARAVLKQAFELLVIKPILDSLFGGSGGGGGGGILGKIFKFADGAAFSGGKVTAFANGGVVNGPTVFPMANGMGLMGEAGPEAVMPLKRGKNGKLGVQVEGGQQPVVINQSFNFSANGDESVKRIIAQEAPRIASLTQKQILDQRRRGGTFKSTFG